MNPTIKKILPHVGALVIFFLIAIIYFKPYALDNKVLGQQDLLLARGMQGEITQVVAETGKVPLWSNAMFSGMPTFPILMTTNAPIKHVFKAALLGHNQSPPWPPIFLMMAGFYLLMLVLRVDWRIGIIGAIAFGLATNHIILVEAGHMTKLVASAYMAPILAGVILTFRGKYLLGGGLTALCVGLQIFAYHVQITYYWIIILSILAIFFGIQAFREDKLAQFGKAIGVLALAGIIGVACNTSRLWTTYEYSKESIRGESELVNKDASSSGSNANTKGGGLSYDYAFNWSYGVGETFNLMIPAYRGGSSFQPLYENKDSEVRQFVSRNATFQQLDPQTQNTLLGRIATPYWGPQPFTSGPVYMGIILFFLFFLGCVLVKSPIRWWVITGVVLTIMLAWGNNFKALNYFIFDYFPMYNKFRAQTMILGITNLLVAILGFLGLQQLFSKELDWAEKKQAVLIAGGAVAGLLVLAALLAFGADFGAAKLQETLSGFPEGARNDFINAVAADRSSLLWGDLMRSFIFLGLAFGAAFLYVQKTIKPVFAIGIIGLLMVIDTWSIDWRFLNHDKFETPKKVQERIDPEAVDNEINADPDLHYRVFDMEDNNPWQNSLPSFHHKSIGGYHAAKLMRYQELIETHIGQGISQDNKHLFDMLNMKYMVSPQRQAQRNPDALGNAWFVSSFDVVENADAEMAAIANFNPAQKAIFSKKYAGITEGLNLQYDSTATIKLTSYHPDEMLYQYSAKSPQLAVFSEVYYPEEKGWHLYIGEERVPMTKANFLLRAAILPAGQSQELRMVFEPSSYYTGEKITITAGLLAILATLAGLFFYFKNNNLPNPSQLPEPEVAAKPQKTVAKKPTKSKKKKK